MKQVVSNDALFELTEEKKKKYTNALLPNANSSKTHYGDYDTGNAIFNNMSAVDGDCCLGEGIDNSSQYKCVLTYPYLDVSNYDDLPYFMSGANRDYEYEVPESDVVDFIYETMFVQVCKDFPEFNDLYEKDNDDEDALVKWLTDHVDELVEKYNDELLEEFEQDAIDEFVDNCRAGNYDDSADFYYERDIDRYYGEGISIQEAWEMMNLLDESDQLNEKDSRDSLKNNIQTNKFSGIVYYNSNGAIINKSEIVGALDNKEYIDRYKYKAGLEKSKNKDCDSYRIFIRGKMVADSDLTNDDATDLKILVVSDKNSWDVIDDSDLEKLGISINAPLETIAISLFNLSNRTEQIYAIMKNGEIIFNTKKPSSTKFGASISDKLKSDKKSRKNSDKIVSDDICQIIIFGFRHTEKPEDAIVLYKSKKFKCLSNKIEDTLNNHIKTVSVWKMSNNENSKYSAWADIYSFNTNGNIELRYTVDPTGMRPDNFVFTTEEQKEKSTPEEPKNVSDVTDDETNQVSSEDKPESKKLKAVAKKVKKPKTSDGTTRTEARLLDFLRKINSGEVQGDDRTIIEQLIKNVFKIASITKGQYNKIYSIMSSIANSDKDFDLHLTTNNMKAALGLNPPDNSSK